MDLGLGSGDLGEDLRKRSCDLDWMLSGREGMPMIEYLNDPLV